VSESALGSEREPAAPPAAEAPPAARARPHAEGGAAGALELRALSASEDAARDAWVEAHPRGTLFHLSGWRRAVARVFGHRAHDLGAFQDGRLVGVLPLVRCATPLGAHLISVPYGVYGGPLGETRDVEQALVARAAALARELRVGRLELRTIEPPPAPPGLELVPHDLYATFVRDLPDDPALVMKDMPKRARAEVRKARDQHGLTLSEGAWFVDDLARLFHASKKGLGSPALPLAWFQALCDELGPRALVHLVRSGDGAPVAATMSFVFRRDLYLYYIGTSDEGNRTYKATNYVCTALQELAVERGLERFDLGRSRVDSGPYAFKKHQGFEPTPLAYRLLLVRSRAKPTFNPSNPRTQGLRDTWSKLPDWLTVRLSRPLSRYLP
jgi:FemAB-related protein (PEP-CTERM system-associated)